MTVPGKKDLIQEGLIEYFIMNLRVEEEKQNDNAVPECEDSHSGDVFSYQEDSITAPSSSFNNTNSCDSITRLKKNESNQIIRAVFLFAEFVKNVIHWFDIIILCILDLKMKVSFMLQTIICMYYKFQLALIIV